MSRRGKQDRGCKPSIAFHMIRHAESNNNKVYGDAKNLFCFGSPDYDQDGFEQYVDTHRRADPYLSPLGIQQADALATEYLNPAVFEHLASSPIRILCSPMLRTLMTIRPAIEQLILSSSKSSVNDSVEAEATSKRFKQKIHLIIVSFYHEIEGCHTKGNAEPGMNRKEIFDCLFSHILDNNQLQISRSDIDKVVTLDFVGFDGPNDGWYSGTGHESRVDAEARAAKYCLWLTEYLDGLMYKHNEEETEIDEDLFDVGFLLPGEDLEDEHDRFIQRLRRRRTVLAIGHGDFMSVVLKRLVGGYVGCGQGGRLVEQSGLPHRTAFAHYNTGITELEYFGHSRFIVMAANVTPHIPPERHRELRSGGTLRDGWAFTVPPLPEIRVVIEALADTDDTGNKNSIDGLHDHVQEQIAALRSLYLTSSLLSEEMGSTSDDNDIENRNSFRFTVKRGFQVLAVATYSEWNKFLTDVAIRPTAMVADTLVQAIKEHAVSHSKLKGNLLVRPLTVEDKRLFERMGFTHQDVGQNNSQSSRLDGNQQSVMTLLL